MTASEFRSGTAEKLVENRAVVTLDDWPCRTKPTKKRAYGHLRQHRVGKRIYYSYCLGSQREVYLGSGEHILSKVRPIGGKK